MVDYVSRGLTNNQIAGELGVSLATVKRHLNNIMIKWDCSNRTQVAVQATLRRAGQPIPRGRVRRAGTGCAAAG